MPYRRKDSPVWWASYTDASGRRVRRTTGTTDRGEAEALEAKWKLEAFKQQQWGDEPTHTFDELMLAYLKATAGEKRCAENDRYHARSLYRCFSGRELSTLQVSDIRGYVDMRRQEGRSPATINRELGLLSAAINYARREWKWNITNSVSGRKLKEPEGRVRWTSRAEADALVRAAATEPKVPWLAHFIRLGLHTGCRKGELLGLEWRRVDLQAGLIHLEAVHTKAGKRRSVPINAVAREAIMQLLRFRAEHAPTSPWVFCNRKGGADAFNQAVIRHRVQKGRPRGFPNPRPAPHLRRVARVRWCTVDGSAGPPGPQHGQDDRTLRPPRTRKCASRRRHAGRGRVTIRSG